MVPSDGKAPGFVRRPHRSRGRSKAGLGTRDEAKPLRAFGSTRRPTRVSASDSSRPLVPRAEAWSSRSDRRSGSSTPSRVTGAPPPAAFDGRRRRSRVGVRGNGSLSGVLDLHEGLQKSSGESDSSDSHGDGRRSGSSKAGIVHAIRREAIRVERQKRVGLRASRSNRPPHLANPDDRKRMKRHETRHPPGPG